MSASSYANLVQDLYVAYFGRPADYYGLQNFEAALAAANAPTDPAALATAYSTNSAVKSLVDSFGTSAESTNLYGSGSTESFVNAIFENLFGRPAAVAGLSFWVNAINSGQVSKGDAALAILAGAEANTSTQGKADWALITAKVGVANAFTTALGSSSTEIVSYSGATAAQDARLMLSTVTAGTTPSTFDVQTTINNIVAGNNQHTFTLTTGVDTLTGGTGNNVFNAILDNSTGLSHGGQAATLQAFDTITGGTLSNTLNITDFGMNGYMNIPAGATISGITAININTLEGIGGGSTALDLSGWAGLTAINVASADGLVYLKAPDTATVNVNDTAGTVSVSGGSTVTAKSSGNYGIYVSGGAATSSVSLTGGMYDDITDKNHGSGKANSITTVSIDDVGVKGTYSYTTIDSDALTTLSVSNEAAGVYVNAAAGTRTLTVNLDNDGPGYVSSTGAWIEDNSATTVDVNAVNHASDIYLQFNSATAISFNDAVDLSLSEFIATSAKAVSISGAGAFTADLNGLAAAAAIDATGASGVVTVTLASAGGQSFTGGAGQDVVTIGATQTGTVTGGSATNNEIVLHNAPAATEADIASTTHFSILGVSGTTSGTFDMSKVAGYTSFDVQSSGGNVSFINAAAGSTIAVDNGNTHVITLQMADSTGQSDTTTLTLNAATGGTDFAQVTLEDSINVGIGTVNLVANNSGSGANMTLTSLYDYNWVTLNVSGTGYLEIGTSNVHSTALTIDNTETAKHTQSLTIATLNDAYLTSLTFNGSEGAYIANLNSAAHTLTIVDNNTSSFEIGAVGDTALTSATFTNSVNSSSATLLIDGALVEKTLTTLNLNGNVALTVNTVYTTSGITVSGGTDNATVSLDFSGAPTASGASDSVTLGNGDNDRVLLGGGDAHSTQTVVVGSGANDDINSGTSGTITVTVGSSTAGTDTIVADSAASVHITAGNGTNTISAAAASVAATITVGTGANSITVGNTASGTITLGTHTATTADSITLGVSNSTTTSVAGMEKIVGLNNAGVDSLVFSGEGTAITAMIHITASQVSALGGDTTLLSDWIATAAGKGGAVTADTVAWFQYQGNTYLVDLTAADAGALSANDTVVELTGTSYTFAKTTFTGGNGHVNLLG